MTKFLSAYLDPRVAEVVVEGRASEAFEIANQVFQGTVLGPPLWNLFFADVQLELQASGAQGSVYADDLNAYKEYCRTVPNSVLLDDLQLCAEKVHRWGVLNQVVFDPGKESFSVLHRTDYEGPGVKLLGVDFDPQLTMEAFCTTLAKRCNNKLKALLRTRRFYTTLDLVRLYKTHLLSLLEMPTPAVFHAARTHLDKLDAVQRRFLQALGLSEEEAFLNFNLGPLGLRRSVAMLGCLHRCVYHRAHEDLCALFTSAGSAFRPATRRATQAHSRQLQDLCDGSQSALLQRSVFGLVRVWNELPAQLVETECVSSFQGGLQHLAKTACFRGDDNWRTLFTR